MIIPTKFWLFLFVIFQLFYKYILLHQPRHFRTPAEKSIDFSLTLVIFIVTYALLVATPLTYFIFPVVSVNFKKSVETVSENNLGSLNPCNPNINSRVS